MTYGLFERIHGHLGILGLALLLHPVLTLPASRTWTRRTAWFAALALVVPFGLGWWLYPEYRADEKPHLPVLLRDAFEVKEHLAALAVGLVIPGAIAARGGEAARRIARHLLGAAWLCALAAGLLGVWIAGRP